MKEDSAMAPAIALPQWNFERRITSLRVLTEFGLEHGMPAGALLAGTGVGEEQLSDPAFSVSGRQELRLLRNLVHGLAHIPALGLEVGRRYHFTAFGALGLAVASSASLRAALDLGQRFSELTFGFTRMRVEDTVREVLVTIDDPSLPDDLRRFMVECACAVMLTVGRDLVPSGPPLLRVALGHQAPKDIDPYESFFGIKPVFRSPSHLLVLDRERLETPLALANEHVRSLAEKECQRLLDIGRARSSTTGKVRDRLEARFNRLPDMDEVASELHVTLRTLRRRLGDEGTTFAKLRDEVRMERAEQLLTGAHLSLDEIAVRLGYAGATSFVNAFKRCRGATPHRFRKDNTIRR
jgi:AraC-like DNA-binding protein